MFGLRVVENPLAYVDKVIGSRILIARYHRFWCWLYPKIGVPGPYFDVVRLGPLVERSYPIYRARDMLICHPVVARQLWQQHARSRPQVASTNA
jgi:hypothetical protein